MQMKKLSDTDQLGANLKSDSSLRASITYIMSTKSRKNAAWCVLDHKTARDSGAPGAMHNRKEVTMHSSQQEADPASVLPETPARGANVDSSIGQAHKPIAKKVQVKVGRNDGQQQQDPQCCTKMISLCTQHD